MATERVTLVHGVSVQVLLCVGCERVDSVINSVADFCFLWAAGVHVCKYYRGLFKYGDRWALVDDKGIHSKINSNSK